MDTLCIQQKCDESALCVQQIDVAKGIKFRSRWNKLSEVISPMFVESNL